MSPEIIDIGGLDTGDTRTLDRVAAEVEGPSRSLGMFHIVGHGLAENDLARFEAAMHALFALPAHVKQQMRRSRDNAWGYYDEELTKNRPDWKEIFDYGAERDAGLTPPTHSDGTNRWPTGDAAIRTALLQHHTGCVRLGRLLLSALSVSLGFEPDRLAPFFEGDSSFVRLNHYPACEAPAAPDSAPLPKEGHLGVHPHTDAGALTILYQDRVASLQVEVDDRFMLVEPIQGALTVNLGDMLRVWSNDRYRSPVHRVLAHRDQERFSAPFFYNPRYDTVCEPILAGATHLARFRPVSWALFRDQRSAGDYADYGSEIQVDDFLVGSSQTPRSSTRDAAPSECDT
ncbi:MAG: 2OG-Fe(II) oxygenase family protein [Myxococcota bacterium]|nr:2OG-Fe(II) oxygenase family protein [Myxococcota bacterium]